MNNDNVVDHLPSSYDSQQTNIYSSKDLLPYYRLSCAKDLVEVDAKVVYLKESLESYV